ncbi:uncharacterized protein K452DRAFT_313907 [Aplosporella prunicola CBS 121167]|uniref:BTB domain-containing protein n=1 Tax=Aplosporella prunicola CBS 121167 TaxID=1176127 RepID=A0A6A6AX32_9PEZI|nr:uncharacterized protein K452DRAFT_313907 [Aplosporella prunicola CBS 121167]KAF2135545.1 hypothetical protein K452DRAFT_313907 [Aplosporella prunicola CBS 121167]
MTLTNPASLLSDPCIPIVVEMGCGGKYEFSIYKKVLQAFSTKEFPYFVGKIIMPPSVTTSAMEDLVNWIYVTCRTSELTQIPMQDSFIGKVSLYRAAVTLGIGHAENALWDQLKSEIQDMAFEAEHLEAVYCAFEPND